MDQKNFHQEEFQDFVDYYGINPRDVGSAVLSRENDMFPDLSNELLERLGVQPGQSRRQVLKVLRNIPDELLLECLIEEEVSEIESEAQFADVTSLKACEAYERQAKLNQEYPEDPADVRADLIERGRERIKALCDWIEELGTQ